MADFKINGVTFASESGGVVSLSNANIFPVRHIIQTQTAVSTTTVNPASNNNFVDSGLSVNITPKFNNSKIYLHHVVAVIINDSSYFGLRIQRIAPSTASLLPNYTYWVTASWSPAHSSYVAFDTPNTTQMCTYKLQVYKTQGNVYWNYNGPGGGNEAQLIAMEIKQ